jgi:hypothetical protein
MTQTPRLTFDDEAKTTLSELMNEYAAELVQQALTTVATSDDLIEISAADLRAAAKLDDHDREQIERTSHSKKPGVSTVQRATTILRLGLAVALVMVATSTTVVTAILLPAAVHSTTARIWVGVGVSGALIASLTCISLYVVRVLGEEAIGTLLQWITSNETTSGKPPPIS